MPESDMCFGIYSSMRFQRTHTLIPGTLDGQLISTRTSIGYLAFWTHKSAHVLNDADDRYAKTFAEVDLFTNVKERHLLKKKTIGKDCHAKKNISPTLGVRREWMDESLTWGVVTMMAPSTPAPLRY